MATDYDAPRRDEVDLGEDSLEELKSRRAPYSMFERVSEIVWRNREPKPCHWRY